MYEGPNNVGDGERGTRDVADRQAKDLLQIIGIGRGAERGPENGSPSVCAASQLTRFLLLSRLTAIFHSLLLFKLNG